MGLAIYLDAVLPDANGVRRPPWFFLLPSYWRRGGVRGFWRCCMGQFMAQANAPCLLLPRFLCPTRSPSRPRPRPRPRPTPSTPPPLPRLQRGSLRAAARALGEPTESECGLLVDEDVAEEAARQRTRCAAYLRQAAGGTLAPAEAVLLPAQLAVMPAPGNGAAGAAAAGAKRETAEGEDLSLAGRPFAVEMFGLRKAYKVWGFGIAPPLLARQTAVRHGHASGRAGARCLQAVLFAKRPLCACRCSAAA